MKCISVCSQCGKSDLLDFHYDKDKSEYIAFCNQCQKIVICTDKYIESPYERTRNAVYATGNKWAIENFNATHN